MKTIWTRYTEIEPTDEEEVMLEAKGSGMVKRWGQYICLLAQTDERIVWGIEDSDGELMVAEIGSVPLAARKKITEEAEVIPDSYAQGFVVRTYDDRVRMRLHWIVTSEKLKTQPEHCACGGEWIHSVDFSEKKTGGYQSSVVCTQCGKRWEF